MTHVADTKRWVIEGSLVGHLHIPGKDDNLPVVQGRVELTPYAIMEQDLYQRGPMKMRIFLGLEIPRNTDHVCIAWQEMEAFVRALGIGEDIPISAYITRMTDKSEEWPDGIDFLKSREFPVCEGVWQPADHHKDMKNRVRSQARMRTSKTVSNLDSRIEKLHMPILVNDGYVSELIKDYMRGLEEEHEDPSLAMLYFFKVLERVGKKEYGDLAPTMKTKTLHALIRDMKDRLTEKEKQDARSILRWRHTKSEAHLTMRGVPKSHELRTCRKMSHLFTSRAIHSKS